MSAKVAWPAKALQSLKTSSCVDLQGERIDNLSRLGQPKMLRQLNLSYCQIASLSGLKSLPRLETFIADGSQLASLENFEAISQIRKLSLKQTPVASESQFALSVLLVCPHLTSLNDRQIPRSLHQKMSSYPEQGAELVNNGWFAEWPAPDGDRLAELCSQFGVAIHDSSAAESVADDDGGVDTFESSLRSYYKVQRKLVREARERMDLPADEASSESEEEEEEVVAVVEEEDEDDTEIGVAFGMPKEEEEEEDYVPSLVERLAEVLRENGIEFDESDVYGSVLMAVDQLCEEKDELKRIELEDVSDDSDDDN